jgi:uncharacterized protein (TIGR02453 family)
MITPEIFEFLVELKENNNKVWFDAHREKYKRVKADFEDFVEQLITRMAAIDKDIAYLTVKDCTYRIYRDLRFSPDKTPYKTNMGAYLVKGGKKQQLSGYYFHLEPDNCMISGGIWMPQPPVLKKIRQGIYENIDEFIEIIEDQQFKKYFGSFDEDAMLKKAPLNFPKDFEHLNLLKYKSYTVSTPLSNAKVLSNNILDVVVEIFSLLTPLNHFFNEVIEE